MVALDDEFDPSTLELEPGTEVVLEVRNDGERPHNLVIDEIDLSTGTLESGDVVTVKFIVPNTAVTFFCSFHRGMDGRLQPVSG